ncbi:MAG: TIGR04076 family protein [Thermoprotei archaeon]|nr:MAG: TIGR04076 family protein [Thermoprotei archaeon]
MGIKEKIDSGVTKYQVHVMVEEVRGFCAAGYKPGDKFIIEWFYIKPQQNTKICLHALNSMITLLMPFINGVSAKTLGIGRKDDIGYIQCPDPGKPYTNGGTVLFKLERKRVR